MAALNSVILLPLAGCQSTSDPTTTDPLERTEYRLIHLSVWNRDSTAHSVDLVVLRNGEVVYWKTVDVEPDGEWRTAVESFDLPAGEQEPASWTIYARDANSTDGRAFRSTEMVGEDGCIRPIIHVHEGGEMGISEELSSPGCE